MQGSIQTLEFKSVNLAYGESPVLRKCDFTFPMGKNCRLIFANDKERFFFFHGVSQLEGFDRGEYLINGENVLDFSFEEFKRYRVQIGFGFSTRGLIHNLTLRQNLELPLRYHRYLPENEIAAWVEFCAEYFELNEDLDSRPSEVPASVQKSTLILRAVVHKPRLLFLEAPELLLSNRHHASLLQLVDDQRKHGNLEHLFFSTHDENLSDCLSEQIIILSKRNLQMAKVAPQLKVVA